MIAESIACNLAGVNAIIPQSSGGSDGSTLSDFAGRHRTRLTPFK